MLSTEQLEMRRKGITGTDIGAILGRSEFKSPLDVWREKTGQAEPLDMTAAMERGNFLEPALREWYSHRSGALFVEEPGTLVLRGEPRIMATPDGLAHFGDGGYQRRSVERRGLEIKAPGPHAEAGWGEPGTDQVPDAYLLQGVFEMAVLDVERLDFAALLGGELRIYPVQRHRELEKHLVDFALSWWERHVVGGLEPEPTVRERDVEFVTKRLGRATKPHLGWGQLTPEQRLHVEQLVEADRAVKAAERARKEMELRVKMALGEHGGLHLPPEMAPYSRIDWQNTEARPLRWSAALEDVKATYENMRAGAHPSNFRPFDDLLEPHRGPNPRSFCLRTRKGGE